MLWKYAWRDQRGNFLTARLRRLTVAGETEQACGMVRRSSGQSSVILTSSSSSSIRTSSSRPVRALPARLVFFAGLPTRRGVVPAARVGFFEGVAAGPAALRAAAALAAVALPAAVLPRGLNTCASAAGANTSQPMSVARATSSGSRDPRDADIGAAIVPQ